MPSLSRILLPIDFSERSIGAAQYAKTLAGRFGSQVTLLHVLLATPYGAGFEVAGGAVIADWIRNRTELATKDLAGFLPGEWQGLDVSRVLLEGDPAGRIVEFARDQHLDLIIMPTHGYGPFRRFILGSNTAKVLHDADCPVWTGVHMQESPAAPVPSFRRILCAVDLGPQSERTLAWAAWLAREFQAQLTLMHAMACTSDTEGSWRAQVRETVEDEFARLQTELGLQADVLIDAGEPSRVICTAAARLHADVLVIGRGSAAGVFGRLRTNAYAIIRESPCPVVSV
jgi:nucleotide-binding universal stress UspA family protein